MDRDPHDAPLGAKLRERLADNGPLWTSWHVLARGAGRVSTFFEDRARSLERRRGVPGINSVSRNRDVWGTYDWTGLGEEWTMSEPWRHAVVASFVDPYLPAPDVLPSGSSPSSGRASATVVEIGPGAGRWTGTLAERAGTLYLVDITQTTLDLCRERLSDPPHVRYLLADGSSLTGVPDASVDFLWSFDVFVHIAPAEQRRYAGEFRRVLQPGATAVIHHGDSGLQGGWRSAMTADLFGEVMTDAGLTVRGQMRSWGPDERFRPSTEGDVVTVLQG